MRDPRTFYPQTGWRSLDVVREGFFARELYVSQLPKKWMQKLRVEFPADRGLSDGTVAAFQSKKVVLMEYFTEDEWLIGALYQARDTAPPSGTTTYIPVEFERGENPGGVCPIVAAQRLSFDGEPRGQFDQVLGLMKAHIQLMGLVLDYADQAVYSDVWVKDLIGPMSFGGAAYIQLGPQGDIGRLPPAVTDLSVFRELESLIDSMHLAGRWPKTRPGEIDQAIASAKFLEASAGMMNTVIRTYHLIMKRALERALRLMFYCDKVHGTDRPVEGVLRNQQFLIDRDADMIDMKARIRVEYGIGLGHEPAQSAVLGIQASQAGLVSREFVQENFEGITDVELERSRIDVERLRDMAYARLLQGLESGQIPPAALVEIARARKNGDDIFEIFDEFVVKPQEEMLASQIQGGIPGAAPITPGPTGPGGGPGGPAPPAPPPEALLGALGGGGPQSASRLNAPIGDGSFASTNIG
jgi:hypothetical protein